MRAHRPSEQEIPHTMLCLGGEKKVANSVIKRVKSLSEYMNNKRYHLEAAFEYLRTRTEATMYERTKMTQNALTRAYVRIVLKL